MSWSAAVHSSESVFDVNHLIEKKKSESGFVTETSGGLREEVLWK